MDEKKTDDYGNRPIGVVVQVGGDGLQEAVEMNKDIQAAVCKLNDLFYESAGMGMAFNIKFENVQGFRSGANGPYVHCRLTVETLLKV